jgi:hypothetical protein
LPSPTSGSQDRTTKVIQAPPWLIRFLTPFVARHIARSFAEKHPDLGPREIEEKLRADMQRRIDLGELPDADAERLLWAVVSRLPGNDEPPAFDAEKPASAWVLLAANLVPLAGVLLWGWDAFALILLFWMENVVVGVFFMLRMLLADPRDPALWAAKLFMIPFFCFHYGMFTAIHGLFVFMLFGGKRYDVPGMQVLDPAARAATDLGLWIPLAVLVGSHLFSFLYNYVWRGEFQRVELRKLMTAPYQRVVVLHIAIILGGFGVAALGSPVWALLILLAVKIGIDLKAHLKEHSKRESEARRDPGKPAG